MVINILRQLEVTLSAQVFMAHLIWQGMYGNGWKIGIIEMLIPYWTYITRSERLREQMEIPEFYEVVLGITG